MLLRDVREAPGALMVTLRSRPTWGGNSGEVAAACGLPVDLSVLSFFYFLVSWCAIATISAYDTYLVMLYRSVILTLERNPLCSVLISWDPDDLTYFLAGKICGTLLVLGTLAGLYMWHRRWALSVITGVVCFQLGLVLYLHTAPY